MSAPITTNQWGQKRGFSQKTLIKTGAGKRLLLCMSKVFLILCYQRLLVASLSTPIDLQHTEDLAINNITTAPLTKGWMPKSIYPAGQQSSFILFIARSSFVQINKSNFTLPFLGLYSRVVLLIGRLRWRIQLILRRILLHNRILRLK